MGVQIKMLKALGIARIFRATTNPARGQKSFPVRSVTTSPRLLNSNSEVKEDGGKGRAEEEIAADWILAIAKAGADKVRTMSEQEERVARNLIVKKIKSQRSNDHETPKPVIVSLGRPLMFYVFVFLMFTTYNKKE
eukprot:TRINITY_DN7902_c0_g1_i1.p1 TRINITY_DN7902_c0_g1~~TRINITY_DN7902_c0_g1_i1.p1  ORF type:complete len:155 (-),score=28.88 TRINITY_DN7902_c0_g1_i1:56-463(-)